METTGGGLALLFDRVENRVRTGRVVKQFNDTKSGNSFFAVDFGNGEQEVVHTTEVILDPEYFQSSLVTRGEFRCFQRLIGAIREQEENEREAAVLYSRYEREKRETDCYNLASSMAAAGAIALGICSLFILKDYSVAWGLIGLTLTGSGFLLAAGLRKGAL